jgi:hypothetical protein
MRGRAIALIAIGLLIGCNRSPTSPSSRVVWAGTLSDLQSQTGTIRIVLDSGAQGVQVLGTYTLRLPGTTSQAVGTVSALFDRMSAFFGLTPTVRPVCSPTAFGQEVAGSLTLISQQVTERMSGDWIYSDCDALRSGRFDLVRQ